MESFLAKYMDVSAKNTSAVVIVGKEKVIEMPAKEKTENKMP
jgi:hypothetical protein